MNGKMRSVESIPGVRGEENNEEWWWEWIQLWDIVKTFVNTTMYSQYSNNNSNNNNKRI
jgi:hypothetical protein